MEEFMRMALDLALKGIGKVHPNPMVGAVIVKEGRIVGSGYHEHFGQAHAQVMAIASASEDVSGSTLFVTLEPCSHYGKTPPCVDLIIEKKIKKVIIATLDVNPQVSGKGVNALIEAGIEVEVGLLEEQARTMNRRYEKYILSRMPYVLYKSAMTLDGKTATSMRDSKWISNELSRQHSHYLRSIYKGIMVGVDTIIEDDPLLSNRSGSSGNPLRIVVDENLSVPLSSNVITDGGSTHIFTTKDCNFEKYTQLRRYPNVEVSIVKAVNGLVDLKEVMKQLGAIGLDAILLEGGPTLAYSMLEGELIDEVNIFIAPKLIGGNGNGALAGKGILQMNDAIQLEQISITRFDEDIMVKGVVNYFHRNS